MPYKPQPRTCVNCGEVFPYTKKCASEAQGHRIYCSRRCTLQFQRAQRANRLTPAQKANAAKAEYKPARTEYTLPAIHNAEGARFRQEFLKRGADE